MKTLTVKFDVSHMTDAQIDQLTSAVEVQAEDVEGNDSYDVVDAIVLSSVVESTNTCTLCHQEKDESKMMTPTICIACA